MFASYFGVIHIMKGGIESGFTKVPVEEYRPRLLHICGLGNSVHSSEVPLLKSSINSQDVFVLDAGLKVFNWKGKKSSPYEKFHSARVCKKIKDERLSKPRVIEVDQDTPNEEFNEYFKDDGEIQENRVEDVHKKKGSYKKMLRLSDADGTLELTDTAYEKNSLKSEDAFLIDRGDMILIWIGSAASPNEKKFSIVFGQKYLVQNQRPPHVPIMTVQEGQFQDEIEACFK